VLLKNFQREEVGHLGYNGISFKSAVDKKVSR
jgi:hypothetical protein